jgi:hypothetical protein
MDQKRGLPGWRVRYSGGSCRWRGKKEVLLRTVGLCNRVCIWKQPSITVGTRSSTLGTTCKWSSRVRGRIRRLLRMVWRCRGEGSCRRWRLRGLRPRSGRFCRLFLPFVRSRRRLFARGLGGKLCQSLALRRGRGWGAARVEWRRRGIGLRREVGYRRRELPSGLF